MVRRFFESRSVQRTALFLGVLVLIVAQSSSALFAQNMSSTASISGIVTDPQGARVTGATLTLSSQDQGAPLRAQFTTDSSDGNLFVQSAASGHLHSQDCGLRICPI